MSSNSSSKRSSVIAWPVMLASGFAGLGYQIVWTQQAALWLGHEAAAVLAVVTAFFAGLALGAALLGPTIENSARPERWYAGCELTIAAWSLALALLLAPVSAALQGLTGAQPTPLWQWTVAFGGTFLVLLPATAAMGATLPAMARLLDGIQPQQQPHQAQPANSIGALYACNTLGAVLGVLAGAFWLVPALGLAWTAGVCALLNLACAAAALTMRAQGLPARPSASTAAARPWLSLLAATGLLGIAYEVLIVRVLSQLTEDTVYTFALLLAVYLVGTALGAAAYQRGWVRDPRRLLLALAIACLLGTASLWAAADLRSAVQTALGSGMRSALAAEAALALAAFGLPTVVMGALFSALSTQAQAAGVGFARALAVNTLGAAAAPLLVGLLLVPALGAKLSLLLLVAGYLALLAPAILRAPGLLATATATLATTLALALWAPPLSFVELPEGGHIVSYQEGVLAAVSVVEDADGVSRLRINNRQQEGSSSSLLADARQALLPLLLHPAPRRALFLGLGTGITAASAAADPSVQVDAVELLPEVIAAAGHFTPAVSPSQRLHMMSADARRFVRVAEVHYDVIVADNFHPARSGSGSLYTVEHFQAVNDRLAAGGLFCQWLPLHQLDLDTLRSIVQSFVAANPGAWAMLATNSLQTPVLGLIARKDSRRFDPQQLQARLAANSLPQRLADYGLADDFALLGGFVAGPQALRRFAGTAPLNTDDHPVVAYLAPRITYAPDTLPRERLLALLQQLQIRPDELLTATPEAARLAAYWAARDGFLAVGRGVQPSADAQRMLAQVREPLLAVLKLSPDFRPAYDPLLRMAAALGPSDAPAARSLLTALVQVQPARPEAAQALRELGAATR